VELVVLIGIQGAGKSTFYQQHLRPSHALVSKDLRPKASNKEAHQQFSIDALLREGRHVAVDNTNHTRAARQGTLSLGAQWGARCLGYFFPPDLPACLVRNAQRSGIARVPEHVVARWAREIEAPSLAEGFDALFVVQNTPGGFVVAPWPG
jgi:predicted kinase